jgi:hypothetical protein
MCEAEGLEDLSPAAKLVYRVLEEIGSATRPDIQDEAMLPRQRTIDSLATLIREDAVETVGSSGPKPAYDVAERGEP